MPLRKDLDDLSDFVDQAPATDDRAIEGGSTTGMESERSWKVHAKEKRAALDTERGRLEHRIVELESTLTSREHELARVKDENIALRDRIVQLKEALDKSRVYAKDSQDLFSAKAGVSADEHRIEMHRAKQDVQRDEGHIADLTVERAKLKQEMFDMREANRRLEAELHAAKNRVKLSEEEQRVYHSTERTHGRQTEVIIADKNEHILELDRQLTSYKGRVNELRRQLDLSEERCEQLTKQLSTADRTLRDFTQKLKAGSLVEVEETRRQAEELEIVEERLKMFEGNVRRLLLVLAESPEWSNFVRHSEATDNFIYVGDEFDRGAHYSMLDDMAYVHDRRHDTPRLTAGPSGSKGRHADPRQPKSSSPSRKKKGSYQSGLSAPSKVLAEVRHDLRVAVEQYNRNRQTDRLSTGVAERPINRSREADYWIPQDAFTVMSKFRSANFPRAPPEQFYELLVSLCRVWKTRMESRIEAVESERKSAIRQVKLENHRVSSIKDHVEAELSRLRTKLMPAMVSGPKMKRLIDSLLDQIKGLMTEVQHLQDDKRQYQEKIHSLVCHKDPSAGKMDEALRTLADEVHRHVDYIGGYMLPKCADLVRNFRQSEAMNEDVANGVSQVTVSDMTATVRLLVDMGLDFAKRIREEMVNSLTELKHACGEAEHQRSLQNLV